MTPESAAPPVSGRFRVAALTSWRGRVGGSLPKLAALGLVLIGALAVVAGGLQATVLAPAALTRATLLSPRQPVITSSVGLLGLDGPRAQIDVTDRSRRPVFLGIGRAADVEAYLAGVSRLEVTGEDGDGGLLTTPIGTEPKLPDPAGVDVWVSSVRGTGTVNLVWPQAPGQWRMVVATDGVGRAPDRLTVTWSGRERHSPAPALIAIGLVLTVVGVITLVMLSSRARLDGAE